MKKLTINELRIKFCKITRLFVVEYNDNGIWSEFNKSFADKDEAMLYVNEFNLGD